MLRSLSSRSIISRSRSRLLLVSARFEMLDCTDISSPARITGPVCGCRSLAIELLPLLTRNSAGGGKGKCLSSAWPKELDDMLVVDTLEGVRWMRSTRTGASISAAWVVVLRTLLTVVIALVSLARFFWPWRLLEEALALLGPAPSESASFSSGWLVDEEVLRFVERRR